MNGLSDEQIAVMLAAIKPHRVQERDGRAYVEAHDIRAMLIRVFGPCGWSLTESVELAFEERDGVDGADVKIAIWKNRQKVGEKSGVRVCYRAHARLSILLGDWNIHYEGTGSHTATMGIQARGEAHDSAMKAAASDALKRAAISLGDQFGLGLYALGSNWNPSRPVPALVQKIVGESPEVAELIEVLTVGAP